MNYDEIVKALEEEKKLNDELGKVGEGVDDQLSGKRVRNGGDLDSLVGIFDLLMLRNSKDNVKNS